MKNGQFVRQWPVPDDDASLKSFYALLSTMANKAGGMVGNIERLRQNLDDDLDWPVLAQGYRLLYNHDDGSTNYELP